MAEKEGWKAQKMLFVEGAEEKALCGFLALQYIPHCVLISKVTYYIYLQHYLPHL